MPATNNQAALAAARELFEKTFGEVSSNAKVLAVHAPGRSEISGNHTDHEGGHVIAGALDVAVDGVAVANGTNVVRIIDANFPLVEVDLSDLSYARTSARPLPRWSAAWRSSWPRPGARRRALISPLSAPFPPAAVFPARLRSRPRTAAPWRRCGRVPPSTPSSWPR